MEGLTIITTSHNSLAHLRTQLLGWNPSEIDLDRAPGSLHLAVCVDEPGTPIVAGASCGPAPCPQAQWAALPAWRFWAVAVLEPFQGRGIGAALLEAIVTAAGDGGARLLWANARQSALPYYAARGFTVCAPPFTDPRSGLVDQRVVRPLSRPDSSQS